MWYLAVNGCGKYLCFRLLSDKYFLIHILSNTITSILYHFALHFFCLIPAAWLGCCYGFARSLPCLCRSFVGVLRICVLLYHLTYSRVTAWRIFCACWAISSSSLHLYIHTHLPWHFQLIISSCLSVYFLLIISIPLAILLLCSSTFRRAVVCWSVGMHGVLICWDALCADLLGCTALPNDSLSFASNIHTFIFSSYCMFSLVSMCYIFRMSLSSVYEFTFLRRPCLRF